MLKGAIYIMQLVKPSKFSASESCTMKFFRKYDNSSIFSETCWLQLLRTCLVM